ncbi:MAG TPA: DUF1540 domain-containing protein [Syntrophomonadaceae bacterium]|nr:DUF1540 domain-containing protein [Syntrophomonadaceae bacterium]
MPGQSKKESKSLNGVKCVVDRCHFWGSGDCCMASMIQIEPRNASTSEDTDCATFRPK